MEKVGSFAWENLQKVQKEQEWAYNKGGWAREFAPRDLVLLLLLMAESKLMVWWQCPFEVVKRVGSVNYEIYQLARWKDSTYSKPGANKKAS